MAKYDTVPGSPAALMRSSPTEPSMPSDEPNCGGLNPASDTATSERSPRATEEPVDEICLFPQLVTGCDRIEEENEDEVECDNSEQLDVVDFDAKGEDTANKEISAPACDENASVSSDLSCDGSFPQDSGLSSVAFNPDAMEFTPLYDPGADAFVSNIPAGEDVVSTTDGLPVSDPMALYYAPYSLTDPNGFYDPSLYAGEPYSEYGMPTVENGEIPFEAVGAFGDMPLPAIPVPGAYNGYYPMQPLMDYTYEPEDETYGRIDSASSNFESGGGGQHHAAHRKGSHSHKSGRGRGNHHSHGNRDRRRSTTGDASSSGTKPDPRPRRRISSAVTQLPSAASPALSATSSSVSAATNGTSRGGRQSSTPNLRNGAGARRTSTVDSAPAAPTLADFIKVKPSSSSRKRGVVAASSSTSSSASSSVGPIEADIVAPPVSSATAVDDSASEQAASSVREDERPSRRSGAGAPAATTKPKRGEVAVCIYGAACKNARCQYYHPTELCRYYPNCRYEGTCLYVHRAPPAAAGAAPSVDTKSIAPAATAAASQ
ncbi:hypothetical protein HK405_008452 [Cladochytrium tenue]|nr:hypothetical protein HK405_008452 [Cladochytrium tenue]